MGEDKELSRLPQLAFFIAILCHTVAIHCNYLKKMRAIIQRYNMAALVKPLSSHHELFVVKHKTGAVFLFSVRMMT